ncbi:MAG: alpha/beta fold hydrolase, partial [Actinobacteria bacterium]|nr:alpha/beta fold hydrolase [Actinomycetota bacterium]
MGREHEPGHYPGAVAPDRSYRVDTNGVGIAVHEWGSEHADPLFLVHGGMDFARTYDVFAPKLAAAGWRVVAWDQRGHGDSQHAALYGWDSDVLDAIAVMEATTSRPAPVVAHSKGGALMVQLADAHPFRFSHLINLDGIPNRRPIPDVSEHERTRMVAS